MAEQIISKKCSRCKEIKPISEFSKSLKEKDGRQTYCKLCQKKYAHSKKGKTAHKYYHQSKKGKARHKRYKKSEKGRQSNKKYNQSKKGRITRNKAKQTYLVRNPEYNKAISAVNIAVRNGELPRANTLQCHYCPAKAKEYHHHKGYAPEHWLDVVPVCVLCHSKTRLS